MENQVEARKQMQSSKYTEVSHEITIASSAGPQQILQPGGLERRLGRPRQASVTMRVLEWHPKWMVYSGKSHVTDVFIWVYSGKSHVTDVFILVYSGKSHVPDVFILVYSHLTKVFILSMGVSHQWGYPPNSWMVYFMENHVRMGWFEGYTHFWKPSYLKINHGKMIRTWNGKMIVSYMSFSDDFHGKDVGKWWKYQDNYCNHWNSSINLEWTIKLSGR